MIIFNIGHFIPEVKSFPGISNRLASGHSWPEEHRAQEAAHWCSATQRPGLQKTDTCPYFRGTVTEWVLDHGGCKARTEHTCSLMGGDWQKTRFSIFYAEKEGKKREKLSLIFSKSTCGVLPLGLFVAWKMQLLKEIGAKWSTWAMAESSRRNPQHGNWC